MTAFAYLPDGCDSIGIVEARLDAEKIVRRARVDSRRLEILTRHGLGESYAEIAADMRLSVSRVSDLAHQAERRIDCEMHRIDDRDDRRHRSLPLPNPELRAIPEERYPVAGYFDRRRRVKPILQSSPVVVREGDFTVSAEMRDRIRSDHANLFCATCQAFYWRSDFARECEEQHAAVFARLCADDEASSTAAVGKDPAPP